jgi:alpha-glucosidase
MDLLMLQRSQSLLEQISISWSDGALDIHESRGFFQIQQTTTAERTPEKGAIQEEGNSQHRTLCVDDKNGVMELREITPWEYTLTINTPSPWSRTSLSWSTQKEETIWGCGTQLSRLNLKGSNLPILTREPGIGRGVQPLTFAMNTLFGAGGEWHCTSAPAAWFISSLGFGVCIENEELTHFFFDNPKEHRITIYAQECRIRFFFGTSPSEILKRYTAFVGRFPILPDWIHTGAMIGLQGGSEKVRRLQQKLERHNTPVSSYWLQDWVGGRKTSIGTQLWWNWELDPQIYPDWNELREELSQKKIGVLSYINPFLVDVEKKDGVRRNLLKEAKEKGLLVCNIHGEPYPIQNTSFHAFLIDLSNPEACIWMKEVIKEQLITTGVRGWMADFAESLPFDEVLFCGSTKEWHNRYPVRWTQLNREAIQEAGKEGEVLFFHRAGFTQTPKYSTLMWMGDQLADWGKEDGLHSAIIGLLSSGFSGFSLNHGDIGGYIATTPPKIPFSIPGFAHRRTKELLLRWIECFSCTSVFRTHEGNQPSRHMQIDHDEETLSHFALFARLYKSLTPYRKKLCIQAHEEGLPVVRAMWLVFPNIKEYRGLDTQFFLGEDLLIAPVIKPKTTTVDCYVPTNGWKHCWSQKIYQEGWHTIHAPIGQPCILTRMDSQSEEILSKWTISEHDV